MDLVFYCCQLEEEKGKIIASILATFCLDLVFHCCQLGVASKRESREQATATTLTATKEVKSMTTISGVWKNRLTVKMTVEAPKVRSDKRKPG